MRKYVSLFSLLIITQLISGCALWPWYHKAEDIPKLPPKTEAVNVALNDYKAKVTDNNKDIVAEAKGIKVLADSTNVPGVPAAIKDSSDIIIKKAGGDTTVDKEKIVMERILAATQGLNEQYKKLYDTAMSESDKKNAALKATVDQLTQSLSDAKAEYEMKLQGVREKAAQDLEKQKQADAAAAKQKADDAANEAFRKTLTICISIASFSSLIAIAFIIARFYLPKIIPARAPFIFFGIAATVMGYAMLANQWWFPYVLGVIFIAGVAEGYKYFKSVTGHLVNLEQYTKLAFELVAGIQKYIKDNNISDEQKKATPLFIAISSALSPESKAVVEQIKAEYSAKKT